MFDDAGARSDHIGGHVGIAGFPSFTYQDDAEGSILLDTAADHSAVSFFEDVEGSCLVGQEDRVEREQRHLFEVAAHGRNWPQYNRTTRRATGGRDRYRNVGEAWRTVGIIELRLDLDGQRS